MQGSDFRVSKPLFRKIAYIEPKDPIPPVLQLKTETLLRPKEKRRRSLLSFPPWSHKTNGRKRSVAIQRSLVKQPKRHNKILIVILGQAKMANIRSQPRQDSSSIFNRAERSEERKQRSEGSREGENEDGWTWIKTTKTRKRSASVTTYCDRLGGTAEASVGGCFVCSHRHERNCITALRLRREWESGSPCYSRPLILMPYHFLSFWYPPFGHLKDKFGVHPPPHLAALGTEAP